ncbi:hypothetical protein CS022_02080 [Veronia nyctiphanis]|uniref:Uncharacterized protein n=1 Tax=Veronia nyctiphanis TaxID=1278244 RepID=A0A4V1LT95_9GAMM|nr:hypothetical protein [Veronia nyctiphanis]RXJ74418.1 hypothetical protein CS022_02080 [Veronia nyctiphanis]
MKNATWNEFWYRPWTNMDGSWFNEYLFVKARTSDPISEAIAYDAMMRKLGIQPSNPELPPNDTYVSLTSLDPSNLLLLLSFISGVVTSGSVGGY